MSDSIARPAPVGVSKRGLPAYRPDEVAAYRKALRVTQSELADVLRVSQPYIATLEARDRNGFELAGKTATQLLDGAERLARSRDRMEAEGIAELAAIRSETKAPRRVRLAEEERRGPRFVTEPDAEEQRA